MLAQPPTHRADADPFVLYAKSLHDYTLRLWTESRRLAEEKAKLKAAAAATTSRRQEESTKRAGQKGSPEKD